MNPQFNLGAMLDTLATQVAAGKFGDVSGCVVFLHGQASNAIVTLPIQSDEETARQLLRALAWVETKELPS